MVRAKKPTDVGALWRALTLLLLSLGIFTACGGTGGTTPAAGVPAAASSVVATEEGGTPREAGSAPRVVATFSVLGDLARNVGGDRIALTTLVPPAADAHTFEPSPADSVALAEAHVVFENGLGFEPWLPDLFAASGSKAERVVVSEGVELIAADQDEHEADGEQMEDTATGGEDEHSDDDQQSDGEFDPHVWHDVKNVMLMVEHIRDGLAQVDPTNASAYAANADTFLQQLRELDAFVVERANTLPGERRKLVTTHDTFGYFARRYGFEVVGTTLGSASTEVADPSAANIAELVEQIKEAGVPAVFAENIDSGGITERIAREAGVELAPTLYTDALGEPGSDGETYEQMVRYNVETIVAALSR